MKQLLRVTLFIIFFTSFIFADHQQVLKATKRLELQPVLQIEIPNITFDDVKPRVYENERAYKVVVRFKGDPFIIAWKRFKVKELNKSNKVKKKSIYNMEYEDKHEPLEFFINIKLRGINNEELNKITDLIEQHLSDYK